MSVTTFDCETEEGRKYIESEAIAADRIGKAKNYHPFIFGTGSRVDRLFYDDDAIVRVLIFANISLSSAIERSWMMGPRLQRYSMSHFIFLSEHL